MKIARTKNAVRNIIFGFIYQVVSVLLPFFVRSAMIYYMGSEYVGLSSLFSSILSFSNLAEMGVGSALTFSMYKPIAEDDNDTVCALLNLYRKLYRYIGIIILAAGLLMMPFLKYLIKADCPADFNIYILYAIYLLNTSISYLMFGYKQSLLVAFQRSDIISKRTMIFQFLMNAIQLAVLWLFRNYYIYIIFLPIFTLLTNISNVYIVKRMYPQYTCKGRIGKAIETSIKKKVLALFGTKANSIVMHAADNIVISAFLGLTMVGKYGNYYYIMNSLIGLMTIIYNSLTAGLGNSLELETEDKNYGDFKVLSFLNIWVTTVFSACLLCLYQPFMDLWLGSELLFGMDIVVLLVLYFYIYQMRRIVLTYKDAGGVWWEDRFRPYVVMTVNLVANILMVQVIGLDGVVISTLVSMIISVPWENYTVFKYIFHRSSKAYYWQSAKYVLTSCLVGAVSYAACLRMPMGWYGLILRGVVCMILSNLMIILLYRKTFEFQKSLGIIKQRMKVKKRGRQNA